MVTRIREQLMKGEKTLLMSSFGLGLTWGTMWIKTKPMIIPDVILI
jgi:3-oxoacyl-[acyl carrier protein] synthase